MNVNEDLEDSTVVCDHYSCHYRLFFSRSGLITAAFMACEKSKGVSLVSALVAILDSAVYQWNLEILRSQRINIKTEWTAANPQCPLPLPQPALTHTGLPPSQSFERGEILVLLQRSCGLRWLWAACELQYISLLSPDDLSKSLNLVLVTF